MALLDINPRAAYSIGLDFDKDHLTGVLVDLNGTIHQRISMELDFPSPDEAMELMVSLVEELIGRQDLDRDFIWGVGLGLPGPLGVFEEKVVTNVVNPNAFPGWTNVPVAKTLEKRLDMPIFMENNASAAAAGERWYGEGRHIRNFFYLFFGSGLGSGLIINGRLFEGHTGNAGEIGLIPTESGSDTATGTDKPHLGVFFNIPRLFRQLNEEGLSISRLSELHDAFVNNNAILLAWIEAGIQQLAPFLLAIEYTLDPEAVFLGGRYPQPIINHMRDRLETVLSELRVDRNMRSPKLYCAAAGEDAAALGVATLPIYHYFAPSLQKLMKKTSSQQDMNTVL